MTFHFWHGLGFFAEALTKDCYYLPLLLFFLFFQVKNIRRNAAICFFATAIGVALLWRLLYAMSMGAAERYVQLVGLLAMVILGGGAVLLSNLLVILLKRRNIRHITCYAQGSVALLIIGLGVGKALNPPDQKPYIAEIASELRAVMPKEAILIDCSGEDVRLKSMLGGANNIVPVNLPYTDASFWTHFLTELQARQFQTDDLWVVMRTPIDLPSDCFEQDFRALWHFFPFVEGKSFLTKRYRHTIYRFTFQTGYYGTPYVTRYCKNPLNLRLARTFSASHDRPVTIALGNVVSDISMLHGMYLTAYAPKYGLSDQNEWRYYPGATDSCVFPLTLTAYNALGWPEGRVQTTIFVNSPASVSAASVFADNAAQSPVRGTLVNALLRLPKQLTDGIDLPMYWNNLRVLAPESDWQFEAKRDGGKIKLTEIHISGRLQVQEIVLAAPRVRHRPANLNCLWLGTREISSPALFDTLRKDALSRGIKLNFISTKNSQPFESDLRPSWQRLNSPENGNVFFNSHGQLDFEYYRQSNSFPPVDVVILALGNEELLLSNPFFMSAQRTLPADIRHFLAEMHKQWPDTEIILILPPVPPRSQDSYAEESNNPYLYQFAWGKILNHSRYVATVIENADCRLAKIIPLYLFWNDATDWNSRYSPSLQRQIISESFSGSGIQKTVALILNEL